MLLVLWPLGCWSVQAAGAYSLAERLVLLAELQHPVTDMAGQ